MDTSQKIEYASDFLLAWRAIANGITTQATKTREKYWRHWVTYTKQCHTDPYLTKESNLNKAIIITRYATRVRSGAYGLGHEVKVQSISNALAAISKTIELAGEQSPVYQAHKVYTLPIQRCIEGFQREHPPAIPQLAVPVAVPNEALRLTYNTKCNLKQATGDLIILTLTLFGESTITREVSHDFIGMKLKINRKGKKF